MMWTRVGNPAPGPTAGARPSARRSPPDPDRRPPGPRSRRRGSSRRAVRRGPFGTVGLTGVWGREVHVTDATRTFAKAPVEANRPLSMYSNRWSVMPLRAFPDVRLPRPDRRAGLDRAPGSDVPVIRHPSTRATAFPVLGGGQFSGDLLYDRCEADDEPRGTQPGAGGPAATEMTELLVEALRAIEAPAEQLGPSRSRLSRLLEKPSGNSADVDNGRKNVVAPPLPFVRWRPVVRGDRWFTVRRWALDAVPPSASAMWARADVGHRWRSLVALGLLAGLTAGFGSWPSQAPAECTPRLERLRARTNASDAVVFTSQVGVVHPDWSRLEARPEVKTLARPGARLRRHRWRLRRRALRFGRRHVARPRRPPARRQGTHVRPEGERRARHRREHRAGGEGPPRRRRAVPRVRPHAAGHHRTANGPADPATRRRSRAERRPVRVRHRRPSDAVARLRGADGHGRSSSRTRTSSCAVAGPTWPSSSAT